MSDIRCMRNPQLDGNAFYWRGGPTGVLLIHGFTATTAEVRPLARTLAEHGFTVAGPLLPGHNARPEDANRYRWQDWANAVETAYRELAARCERVVAGGESLGALLALNLAAAHPEIAAVLAYAPALELNMPASRRWAMRIAAPFVPYVDKGHADDGLPWQGYTVYPLRAALELLRLQKTVRRRLPQIRQPLLVVQGRHDRSISAASGEIAYREARSAIKEMHWLPGSAHCVILDCEWDEAARLTLAFLARALPAHSSVMVMAPSPQVDSQL
jgi:carboxylesterase